MSFGELPANILALTCLWWITPVGGEGRSVEADIRINNIGGLFVLDPVEDCGDRWDLEGILTHEFGHVFGLGHVRFAEHGELTMSDGLRACTGKFRSLGLGDLALLRAHYRPGH